MWITKWIQILQRSLFEAIANSFLADNDIASMINRHLQMHKVCIDVIWVFARGVGLVNVPGEIFNSSILCSCNDWGSAILNLKMCWEEVGEKDGDREHEVKGQSTEV